MVQTIMVIGAGQMGGGIAQVAAQAGYNVILNDIKDEFVQRGLGIIDKNLSRAVSKGKMEAAAKDAVLAKIKTSTSLDDAKDADLVVEAAIENMELKANIFKTLDVVCKPEAILATNTSSLPITQIAAVTKRPDKVIGMHFFNPVPVMKLLEIIRGFMTSDETYNTIAEIGLKMGKVNVEVKDSPGFGSNRILLPMINEAFFVLSEGLGTAEDIDNVMKFGMAHPMGPLALADLIGLDTCLNIMNVLYEGFKDSKYRPCPLLVKYVQSGLLGQKTGKGVYDYSK
ncbi:3-hydroxybutyryl-CoA dehydrogenase [Desulfofarcimen acetoxidans DSM 771]|uniref:3-hydroxybutyryl-CoA dehydrogenase n=1 Tax=Desulfofarcimen acetoxidans (strain ATCC 49208 / DSM 771 / KCTC 5769 / VKM B-1644 / 5575) TaxID=485916 RepID=C8VWY3_DESAS|nr:3-hydroxybutyryl-CoA dehydrogenase [Desulfofarcimen acetoxidans]ACV62559.1 3-hydroxybutyryl-CoA dehydrogenase [Desulfofarcimen acetoxidans DSM 771]